MKGFLSILLLSFFAPLHCFDKSIYFFVARRDSKEAICIEPRRLLSSTQVPTFDLDKLQIPRDVGFKYWDWLSEWQLQNDTNVRREGENKVLIAGNQPFHYVARLSRGAYVYILASNISLWMADDLKPRGAGMLFEVDHLNETTKLKDTTLKYCDKNPEVEGAKCTIVDYKNGTNFLNDGNHWKKFRTRINENPTGVEMNEISYEKHEPVVQCTWTNTNISNPFTSDSFEVFAKSHQRNAALDTFGGFNLDLSNNSEMKRKYTKRNSGKLCVDVRCNVWRSKDCNELMEVKNLASGRVQPPTNTSGGHYTTNFQWNHLDASEYEFTLRFDNRIPRLIDLCQDDRSNIWRTWESMPKAITKCQFYVGESIEFSAGPSSPPDPKLKPKWTLGDWLHVCDRLGILSHDTQVQIKFCNLKGCNFSKCPHLHDDHAYIFDF